MIPEMVWAWSQNNILSIAAFIVTAVLFFHYLIEKDYGNKISKKYRASIFEEQSKIFLNATQYLISGNRDLAIKEFLSAMDLNRETLETYFALGGLFRSNGEFGKAISIHHSLVARGNISEAIRTRALKELALDYDRGGIMDKAVEKYKDLLKINPNQTDVVLSLCRIYEDVEEWDEAYKYRILLSKVSSENQAETISHILVQKAKALFEKGSYPESAEVLDDAFKFAPSVSAKILRLKIFLIQGNMEDAKNLLLELLQEHPMYTSFLFISLEEGINTNPKAKELYQIRLKTLKDIFLSIEDKSLLSTPSIILSKIRLLKNEKHLDTAYGILKEWMENTKDTNKASSEVLKVEYIKILLELEKYAEMAKEATPLLDNLQQSLTRHFCGQCGYNSDNIFWRCPQCKQWETIRFRWKV